MNPLRIFQTHNENFYQLFEEVANNNIKAALLLDGICKDFHNPIKIAKQVQEIEHKNDKIVQQIYESLEKIFITPIDREDILVLTKSLDDVTDLINDTTGYLATYNITAVTPIAKSFAKCIVMACKKVGEALPLLQKRNDFGKVIIFVTQINDLESEGDELLRNGLREIFQKTKDPIDVIRWRDIYHTMEDVSDSIEDIGDVLRKLVAKYG